MSETKGKDHVDEEFTIVVGENSLKCHKNLLTEKSEYFRAMIDSCMVESQTNTVTLHDQEFSVVKTLIDFIKTGELSIGRGGKNMRKVTQAAVMLQIPDAIQSCTACWKQILSHENCLEVIRFGKSLHMEPLYSCAMRHALYYFKHVRKTTDFVQLDVKELVEYLYNRDLNCSSEIEVLDALVLWYEHNIPRRKALLGNLLTCFHAEGLKDSEWDLVQSHTLVKESDVWSTFVEETRPKDGEKQLEKFRRVPVMLLTFGGYVVQDGTERPCTDICRFDEDIRTFNPCLSLKEVYTEVGNKMGYQVTVVGKDLYLSGGQLAMSRYSMIMDVWKLDGFELKWERVTKLTSPRRHHGACASSASLFIMGGFGKYRDILDTVQEFNTETGKWTDLSKMPYSWFTPHAVFCENKLYVYKTHLVCLDMATLEWTTIRETPCSVDDMNTFIPYRFEQYIYEFPYLDQELDWFYEFESGKLQLRKTSLVTGEWEAVPYNDSIQFGNRSVVCNERFYTINRQSEEFICGNIQDFNRCKKLGTRGNAGHDCFIVALPHYPDYKINS